MSFLFVCPRLQSATDKICKLDYFDQTNSFLVIASHLDLVVAIELMHIHHQHKQNRTDESEPWVFCQPSLLKLQKRLSLFVVLVNQW
jgi:hypothetical protein